MGRVCMGRVCYGPSLSWAEFVMGRVVQLPSIRTSTTGQFGPRPLVNSEPFLLVNSDLKNKNSLVNSDLFCWSIRTFSIGQFGPFSLVNSDLFHWSIRTFALCIFHKENCVQIKNEPSITDFLPCCMMVSHFIR